MKKSGVPFLLAGLMFLVSITLSAEEGQRVYTGQDLDKYRGASDNSSESRDHRQSESRQSNRHGEKNDKSYYCKWGRSYRSEIETAKRKVEKAERKASDAKSDAFMKKNQRKRAQKEEALEDARQALESAEKRLRDFEEDAHRDGVPPGWLRCQFE